MHEEGIGSSSVDRENDGMANPGSSSQSPAGPAQAQAPTVASYIQVSPRLEMKNGPNPTGGRQPCRRRGSTRSPKYECQCGMLTSAVDDETLRIIDALPYASESNKKKKAGQNHRPARKILSTGRKHYVLTPPALPTTAKGRGNRQTLHSRPAYLEMRRAGTCYFTEDGKDFAKQMIRDRLVCGIRNDVVRQRLWRISAMTSHAKMATLLGRVGQPCSELHLGRRRWTVPFQMPKPLLCVCRVLLVQIYADGLKVCLAYGRRQS